MVETFVKQCRRALTPRENEGISQVTAYISATLRSGSLIRYVISDRC